MPEKKAIIAAVKALPDPGSMYAKTFPEKINNGKREIKFFMYFLVFISLISHIIMCFYLICA